MFFYFVINYYVMAGFKCHQCNLFYPYILWPSLYQSIFTSMFIYINTQFQHFIFHSHPVFLHLVPSGILSRILVLILHVSHLAHPTVMIYKKTLLICYSIFSKMDCGCVLAYIHKRNVCFLPNTHEKITTTSH